MNYKLRAFCKDTNDIHDMKDYKIKDNVLKLISDYQNKEYNIDDIEYAVIYKDTLKDIINTIYENGKNTTSNNPAKNTKTKTSAKI